MFMLMSTGDFPEILSQRILAGIILVGRLGVWAFDHRLVIHLSGVCCREVTDRWPTTVFGGAHTRDVYTDGLWQGG